MSGGVDSSMAAALLKKQGYDFTGVFMHFWKEFDDKNQFENKCCSLESYEKLKTVCRIINIPLIIIHAEKEFKRAVVDYFLTEYKKGQTPNPCIVCNQYIKFRLLIKKMLELNADNIATGHYAMIKESAKSQNMALYKAKDKHKDQSYFLYTLNQKQLSRLLLPLGKYTKKEVKKMAKVLMLPYAENEESQDICFVDNTIEAFLKKYLKLKPGLIFNEDGKILGKHRGLPLYTLGQRKNLNIGGYVPYYVSQKDIAKNRLIVTNDPLKSQLYSCLVQVENINWIAGKMPKDDEILVKTRYRSPEFSAIIRSIKKKRALIEFLKPQMAITPGQSAVFYDKKGKVLGGGIIYL